MIGRRLDHFEIAEPIGAGGMGVVYKAIDLRLQRAVALKVLPPEVAGDPERRGRFEREARAASALNHPNIVTIHEIGSADGVDFIAMELVPGETLDAAIARGMPVESALRYAVEIGEALVAAHAAGVVHRDLKPRNVIVTPAGHVKVVDFGLAKRVAAATLDSAAPTMTEGLRTEPGSLAGTVAYMSPEQAEGRPLDARTDIFSLGVVLYEMLTQRRPFGGTSTAQVLSAILRDAPPPVRSLREGLPEGLDPILVRALEKDVGSRYPRALDLVADLKRIGSAPGPVASAARAAPGGRRRAPWLLAAVAALVLATLVGGRLLTRQSPAPIQFRLLSTFPGSHRAPSLSPDGRMVAFIDVAHDTPQVWVKPLGEGDPVQITSGEPAAGNPRWSPKGDQIVFERSGKGLWSVPPLGGAPRPILEEGNCPSFFPDGDRIVFDRGPNLWVARVDGSEARQVEGVQGNLYSLFLSHCAAVSPDGQWLAYFQPEWGGHGDYWTIPAAGGTPRRLTTDFANGGGVVFSPDGRSVIVSSTRAGSQTLWRVSVKGGPPEALTTGAGEDHQPVLSADGRALVYSNARHAHAILVLDTKTGASRQVLERRGHVNGVVFSHDANRIGFFAYTEQNEQIFTVGIDGRDLRQVTHGLPGMYIMPRFSSDDASLYFFSYDPPSLRRVASSGGQPETVVAGWLWGAVWGVALDPTGRAIAYSQMEKGTLTAARIRDFATGQERGLADPIVVNSWSRDGRFVLGTRDGRVVRCPVEGGPCGTVAEGSFPRPSGDGERIFFMRVARALDDRMLRSTEVWVVAATGGEPRRVAVLEPESSLAHPFDVSLRDEIVWVQFRRGKEELWLAQLPGG